MYKYYVSINIMKKQERENHKEKHEKSVLQRGHPFVALAAVGKETFGLWEFPHLWVVVSLGCSFCAADSTAPDPFTIPALQPQRG